MRRIAIVGAGQSGLQLALGLQARGYAVTVLSNRTAGEIRAGHVLSSQCMFDSALQTERNLGLNFWERECPRVEGIGLTVRGADGSPSLDWSAPLDAYAQSVDQRLKIPAWMEAFQQRGGRLIVAEAGVAELEALHREHDLVIVASGKGAIGALFPRDKAKSTFDVPMRALALTYIRIPRPDEARGRVRFNILPGVGEVFAFPALTTTGPCEILVFEAMPGGPLDLFREDAAPEQHLETSLNVLRDWLPWEAERLQGAELCDANATLVGRYAPVVRKPVAVLPSGAAILGMADAVVLNDPITGQGANNAAKCAEIYLESIVERGAEPFDAAWMRRSFDRYWRGYARWVTAWTNSLLVPLAPHLGKLLASAATLPPVAAAIANGFDDPLTLFPWWDEAAEADRFLDQKAGQGAKDRFDRRDLRRALGQFATGVTVITTRTPDGRRVGMTANSFSSVSLDPPLVLWSLAKSSTSLADFTGTGHFAINILAASQHHLSRQFSTPLDDRFAGVAWSDGTGGVPLLDGVIARFTCRNLRQYDGGDHLIFLGEVEGYEQFDGEPLVFHSGRYRVATRHPDIAD